MFQDRSGPDRLANAARLGAGTPRVPLTHFAVAGRAYGRESKSEFNNVLGARLFYYVRCLVFFLSLLSFLRLSFLARDSEIPDFRLALYDSRIFS